MKKLSIITVLVLFSLPGFAHHAAVDVVDEETYDMIDTLVADTPHETIDLNLDDTGTVTDITISVLSTDVDAIDAAIAELTAIGDASGLDYTIEVVELGAMTEITLVYL